MRKRPTNAAFLLVCLLSELSEGALKEECLFFLARVSRHASPLYLFTRSFGLILHHPSIQNLGLHSLMMPTMVQM
jgi:hypothetical protein